MKKLFSLLLCILLLAGCAEVYDGPTVEKSVPAEFIRESYSTVNDHVDISRRVYYYDIYGNLARTMDYRNDQEYEKTVYTYDDRGNLLTETVYDLTGWFPRKDWSAGYTYDEQDRTLSITYPESKTEYVYDDENRTETCLVDGAVISVSAYDASGNEISEKRFNCGVPWQLNEYTRNEQGQVVTRRETNSEGYDYFVRIGYDGYGNAVRWEINDNGVQKTEQQEYEYDDQGRFQALYDVNADGTRTEKSRREYLDNNGSYILWRDGVRSNLRRFDEQGNLIENSHYVNETDQFGIREFTSYQTIQVRAEEVSP